MKKITADEKKMQLVERLVKEGAIDFTEAIILLEVEVEKEFVTVPYRETNPLQPFTNPQRIGAPWDKIMYENTFNVTCKKGNDSGFVTTNLLAYSNQ